MTTQYTRRLPLQRYTPVNIFNTQVGAQLTFTNRSSALKFSENTPSTFTVDFNGQTINFGTGQYVLVLDEVYNNKPYAPWKKQEDVSFTFNVFGSRPSGQDTLISFQSLLINTPTKMTIDDGISVINQQFPPDTYPGSSTFWITDEKYDILHFGLKSFDTTQARNLIGDWLDTLTTERELHPDHSNGRVPSTDKELILYHTYHTSPGQSHNGPKNNQNRTSQDIEYPHSQHYEYSKSYFPKANDWKQNFTTKGVQPDYKFRDDPHRLRKIVPIPGLSYYYNHYEGPTYRLPNFREGIFSRTFSGIGATNVTNINTPSLSRDLQTSFPIINCLATYNNGSNFKGLGTIGNLHAGMPPKIYRKNGWTGIYSLFDNVKSIPIFQAKRLSTALAIPYGIIVQSPEEFINYFTKDIGTFLNKSINPYFFDVVNKDYFFKSKSIWPLLQNKPPLPGGSDPNTYTTDMLGQWYKAEILNILIVSMHALNRDNPDNPPHFTLLLEWYEIFKTHFPTLVAYYEKMKKISALWWCFPPQWVFEYDTIDVDSPKNKDGDQWITYQRFLLFVIEPIWKSAIAYGLIHFFSQIEQNIVLRKQWPHDIGITDNCHIGQCSSGLTGHKAELVGRKLHFLPLQVPDYFGDNREITLTCDNIQESFTGRIYEQVLGQFIVDTPGYKLQTIQHSTKYEGAFEKQIHSFSEEIYSEPDTGPFHWKRTSDINEFNVIPLNDKNINKLKFTFLNPYGDLIPFSAGSTTTIKVTVLRDNEYIEKERGSNTGS